MEPTITGATNASYIIAAVALTDAGTYDVVVTNSQGSVTSTGATLTVNAALTLPTIIKQPLSQTKYVNQADTFSVVASGNPAPTYQWRKNGANITGATNASYIIAALALTDAGTFDVVVTNSQGSVTSTGAVLTVQMPIKAFFTVSDSIAKAPVAIQFDASQSTGNYTKMIWYFGDGAVDSTNIKNPLHQYNTAGLDSVELVLMNGAVRQDSFTIVLKIYNDNPIAIQGRYVPSGKAEITFSNYGSQVISTGVIPPYADSMKLWYESGVVPTSATGATQCAEIGIAAMQAAPAPFKDTVSVTLAGTDMVAGFMTQVHWNNGTTWLWSQFNAGNGTLVQMNDTLTPVNIASIAGNWLPGTNSVVFPCPA